MNVVPSPPSSYERPVISPGALAGASVMVIGGSSGFGRQAALDCALAGATVTVVGRDISKSHATSSAAGALGTRARALPIDVSTQSGLDLLAESVRDVDHVISTLGGSLDGQPGEGDEAALRDIARRKVEDNRRLVDTMAPRMRDGGSFVLTAGSTRRAGGSDGAETVLGNDLIVALVREKALELAPRLRVNAVAPTWTQTPMWHDRPDAEVARVRAAMAASIPLGRTAEIREVARVYVFLLLSTFVTGQTVAVDGGLSLR